MGIPPLPPPYTPRPPQQAYPQYQQERPRSIGSKVFYIGLICCVLMFGLLAIWLMAYSRESSNKAVASSIVNQWGRSIYINGPVVKANIDSAVCVRPEVLDCDAQVESQLLHRNIYEAEVFTANVKLSGTYRRDSLERFGSSAVIKLDVATRQIINLSPLNIGGREVKWRKSKNYLYAEVDLAELPQEVEFSTEMAIKGSEGLFIKYIGESSNISIDGEASNPSFRGGSLPVERSSMLKRFSARWDETNNSDGIDGDDGYVGTEFLVGVDRYQKVERSMKYSFIIIALTFIGVLFVEIMRKHPIPLLNYFLIGAALIIFYSLLLSFVELLPFGIAYLIASAMTVCLIAGYVWRMLGSRKLGVSIGVVLSLLYLFCYIMLSVSVYALLLGSLLLFFSLAAMMYASLKIRGE